MTFTPDELELLSETDGNEAPTADAGAPVSVGSEQNDGPPVADDVDPSRVTGYAIFDRTLLRYVNTGSHTGHLKRSKLLEDPRYELRRV